MLSSLVFVILQALRCVDSAPLSSGVPRSPRSTSSGTAYSLSLTTFDPNGRLQQLEFAYEAVDQGLPVAAARCTDGVLLVSWGVGKLHISRVSENIAVGSAGLRGDFRSLAARCQKIASKYALDYGCEISVAALAEELSALVQEHTQLGGLRPFGASLLILGPEQIFCVEPSGWVAPWDRLALGSHSKDLLGLLPQDSTIAHTLEKLRTFHSDHDLSSSSLSSRSGRAGSRSSAAAPTDDDDLDLEHDDRAATPSQQQITASLAIIPTDGSLHLFSDIADYLQKQ